jgi:uncharacterized heparinase superfamily protein
VAHRLRLRGQKVVLTRMPGLVAPRLQRSVPPHPGWPDGYLPLDGRLADGSPSAEANAEGRFRFLDHERSLGEPADWEQTEADQLWRYHLHYFEWAWAFASHPDADWARGAFSHLWRSWSEHTTFGRWDAWSPYVVSLRAWALCGAYRPLVAGGPDDAEFRSQMGLHAGFVRANLEFDVGGNHLIKNLKALVGLGVFLDDERLVRLAIHHLERQITVQVLADGGHFELSPSYHCQVLGDLIDVAELLEHAGRPPVGGLDDAIEDMRRWLGVMLMPDGDVPMFNDCVLVGEYRLKLLEPVQAPDRRLTVLPYSGYVVMRPDDRLHLVADVGPPCPAELPAHAHADCLSFELAVDGERVLVNSGTSTYQPGARRAYERSTRAHNTVEIDGLDQTEVWGTFRAARRATPTLERAVDDGEVIQVAASHDGYQRLPGRPRHRRSWRASAGTVQVTDDVTGGADRASEHEVVTTVHVATGVAVEERADAFLVGPLVVTAGAAPTAQLRRRDGDREGGVATGFGRCRPSTTLEVTQRGGLPMRRYLHLRLRVDADGSTEGARTVGEGRGFS